ncbi:alpha/beta hydrolase-fold protein, partial [Acinetobacter baumannii]|uniref:alpha/beta hydrolase-fold protein n=1 Tax=Acinetobacter baumannii TaxID=470 RepID=UPI0037D988CE
GISSANGKWNIDHSLNKFFSNGMQGVIAIGIDSADHESINEYCPWVTKQGGGKGNMYIQFITDTLKPDIDKRLRTKPERDNTAIMGSSMGGLISLYAILARQDV